MELTIAEQFNLNTRILEYIILNPEKIPDVIIPNYDRKMHFRPISAIRNTGFIVCETFDDEQREMFVEIDIQNPGSVNIKYSIPINKSNTGYTELFRIAKAKITSYSYIIEEVIMNDYRDKDFLTSGEIDKIKVQIQNVTTMLLLYAYQIRMQYGLVLIPEEIDDITIVDNYDEKPSESEENDEELSEKEYESLKNTLRVELAAYIKNEFIKQKEEMTSEVFNRLSNLALHDEKRIESLEKDTKSLKDELKTELSTFVQQQFSHYKRNLVNILGDLLKDTRKSIKDEVSDIFHDRFNKLEASNEKMSTDIESFKRDIWGFKRQMAEYTQTLFKKREVQMMDRIIEKLKESDEEKEELKPYNPIAEAVPVYGCPIAVPNDINQSSSDEETALKEFANTLKELCGNVDPKICVKVLKDRTKESNVDESVVFKYNCKDIFAKLARITREMCTRASSTCHESGQLSFRDTINIRGDIDREEFKKILNSPFCRGSYHGNLYQKRFIEEEATNTYHISCVIDSFLSGAVLFKFNIRDNLIYPKGVDIHFNFNDNHDLCVVDNTLWDFDEIKANILFRYMITGNRGDGYVARELMNLCNELKKRKEEVERNGK